MLRELHGVQALLEGNDFLGVVYICTLGLRRRLDYGMTIWPIIRLAFGDSMSHLSIAVVIHDGANRTVDGQFLPIYT